MRPTWRDPASLLASRRCWSEPGTSQAPGDRDRRPSRRRGGHPGDAASDAGGPHPRRRPPPFRLERMFSPPPFRPCGFHLEGCVLGAFLPVLMWADVRTMRARDTRARIYILGRLYWFLQGEGVFLDVFIGAVVMSGSLYIGGDIRTGWGCYAGRARVAGGFALVGASLPAPGQPVFFASSGWVVDVADALVAFLVWSLLACWRAPPGASRFGWRDSRRGFWGF